MNDTQPEREINTIPACIATNHNRSRQDPIERFRSITERHPEKLRTLAKWLGRHYWEAN